VDGAGLAVEDLAGQDEVMVKDAHLAQLDRQRVGRRVSEDRKNTLETSSQSARYRYRCSKKSSLTMQAVDPKLFVPDSGFRKFQIWSYIILNIFVKLKKIYKFKVTSM
jgi:hypothetical protein